MYMVILLLKKCYNALCSKILYKLVQIFTKSVFSVGEPFHGWVTVILQYFSSLLYVIFAGPLLSGTGKNIILLHIKSKKPKYQ